jgi:hypothetical protein
MRTQHLKFSLRRPTQEKENLAKCREGEWINVLLHLIQLSNSHLDSLRSSQFNLFSSLTSLSKPTATYKILPNDWPYALDPSITHLVLWTKSPIPSDPSSPIGDLSPSTRAKISSWIEKKFSPAVDGDAKNRLVWFRNWSAIKSVHAVEHVHVLLLRPERGWVEGKTGEVMK